MVHWQQLSSMTPWPPFQQQQHHQQYPNRRDYNVNNIALKGLSTCAEAGTQRVCMRCAHRPALVIYGYTGPKPPILSQLGWNMVTPHYSEPLMSFTPAMMITIGVGVRKSIGGLRLRRLVGVSSNTKCRCSWGRREAGEVRDSHHMIRVIPDRNKVLDEL